MKTVRCLAVLWIASIGAIHNTLASPAPINLSVTEWISQTRPAVIAHRGCWEFGPENSLKALKACTDLGVRMAEGDLHRTKDGVLVWMHDDTLDRMTNLSGRVDSYTWKELQSARLREGAGGTNTAVTDQPIPSFAEVLAATKGKTFLMLDVKQNNYDEIFDAVVANGAQKDVAFLVYAGPQSSEVQKGRFAGAVAAIPVLMQCGAIQNNTNCYSDDDLMRGRPFKDYARLKPVAYLVVSKGDSWLKMASTAPWHNDVRFIGGEEDLHAGPAATWGPQVDMPVPIILTNYAKELMIYLKTRDLHQ
jgi:Glycerophosphoryl diester phosphodiesterase family